MAHPGNSIAAFCVRRPVLAVVLNLLLIVAGIAAFLGVEVRELPNVDRPVVTVRTTYAGASPQTVDTQVTSVIEGAAARVPGIVSISSSSAQGSSRVTVEFDPAVDIDAAANDLRDAVGRIQRRLPSDAEAPTIVKADADAQAVMQLALTTGDQPIEDLSRLVEDQIVPRLTAVPGVADVSAWGTRKRIFSVVLDPQALAARGLTVQDAATVLSEAALDRPAGTLSTDRLDLLVRADASVVTAEQIARIRLADNVRLGDVATVEERPSARTSAIRINGLAGIGMGIVRQAGSNTLEISREVRRAVQELNAGLPAGVTLTVTADDAVFIAGAISQVTLTMLIATAIVVLVIWLFLRSLRATVIPAIAVPVALIGTLAGLWLMGFSINLLTLLALVLATGLVVDDAIVVLENIVRRRQQEGLGPRAAAVLGTRQVFFAVLATTATLAAVFVPISFLPGTAGALFAEFGFVLAVAVAISSFVALTLCPMLASRLVADPPPVPPDPASWRRRLASLPARAYDRVLDWCLKAPLVVLVLAGFFALAAVQLYRDLPEELTPREDRGVIRVHISAPQTAGLDYLEGQMRLAEEAVLPVLQSGDAETLFTISGRGRANTGFMVIRLAPWHERSRSQDEILAEIEPRLAQIPGVQVSTRTANSLGIRGGGQGLRFALTGTDYDALSDAAEELVDAMRVRLSGLRNPSLNFDTTQPQISIAIDRERAADLGVPLASLSAVLQTMLDGREVGSVFRDDQEIEIWMETETTRMLSPADLENVHLRTQSGAIVPLSAIASIEETPVAPSLSRESQRRAVSLSAQLAPGYDLRRAMNDVQGLAAEVVPAGMGVVFLGEAATLDQTGHALALTFAFALVIVLLVLAAQFESITNAVIIILTVPFGLAAAVMAMTLTGGSLNLYSQIGLILLVGLMAKNGILIVEFANQLRDQGQSVDDAIRNACAIRLRPVVMTLVSTVLGGLPLVLGIGAGAEARAALGWVVVGGLGISAAFTLFLTPVTYRLLAGFVQPRVDAERRLERELAEAMALDEEARLDRAAPGRLRIAAE